MKSILASLLISSLAFADNLEEQPSGVQILEGQVLTSDGPLSVGPGLFLNRAAVFKLADAMQQSQAENKMAIDKYNNLVDLYNDRPSNLMIGLLVAGGLIVGAGVGVSLAVTLQKH